VARPHNKNEFVTAIIGLFIVFTGIFSSSPNAFIGDPMFLRQGKCFAPDGLKTCFGLILSDFSCTIQKLKEKVILMNL